MMTLMMGKFHSAASALCVLAYCHTVTAYWDTQIQQSRLLQADTRQRRISAVGTRDVGIKTLRWDKIPFDELVNKRVNAGRNLPLRLSSWRSIKNNFNIEHEGKQTRGRTHTCRCSSKCDRPFKGSVWSGSSKGLKLQRQPWKGWSFKKSFPNFFLFFPQPMNTFSFLMRCDFAQNQRLNLGLLFLIAAVFTPLRYSYKYIYKNIYIHKVLTPVYLPAGDKTALTITGAPAPSAHLTPAWHGVLWFQVNSGPGLNPNVE